MFHIPIIVDDASRDEYQLNWRTLQKRWAIGAFTFPVIGIQSIQKVDGQLR